ncbi:hypothetical protein ACHQM5_020591 [Ranunculus cassubicifolius]
MGEVPKLLLYIIVVDNEDEDKDETANYSFRYTRSVLQSTLQLMGCKARHAFKISQRVFEVMRREHSGDAFPQARLGVSNLAVLGRNYKKEKAGHVGEDVNIDMVSAEEKTDSRTFELYKKRTTVIVKRMVFLDVVCKALSEYKYVSPSQRADLILACRIREKKESVTVLLCGTSGCGKSTLSALLGSRLGVTTVISTDSIRHMMRSFVDEKQNPLLWASTYHAGEYLDPVAVAEAKAKRKAKKLAHVSLSRAKDEASDQGIKNGGVDGRVAAESVTSATELIGKKQMAIEGFKAQSEMVIDSLDRLITSWEERKESVVVEGVHLSLNFVMGLMKKHPSIIPFMIYITNEDKHMERFAVRAKYMTLDPAKNKYVKYIRNIRTIQDYLCNRADKHLVPKINNTNVDRSVAAIHATVFSCLRRREAGEQVYDPTTSTVSMVDEEYRHQCTANSLSSKGMFQLIQRKGSSRHLMALLNTDGSVAKAWPVDGMPISGDPMYGPLLIGKAEPVNLQFGNFGISAFPNDTGGTSHGGSVDGTESGSRYQSSCCSSPRMSDGPTAKEPKEDLWVSGSDEEADDDPAEDDDLSDEDKQMHDEMEGSVDEESTKSDEEYDDLAMQDGHDTNNNGYWSDDEEEEYTKLPSLGEDGKLNNNKYMDNLNLFLKSSRASVRGNAARMRKRSLSIPAVGKHGSLVHTNEPILSGAPVGTAGGGL